MDQGVIKGPAELLVSKVKAFKNCLDLATECLANKDYPNAEMIYGGLLADSLSDCITEALSFNELDIFSLHSCFAYSSIGAHHADKSEQALVVLNTLPDPIKLPLVPYLKAYVHIFNDRLSFAHDELQCCQRLLKDGYNFKPNKILNERVVPEINDDILKRKINILRSACNVLKAKADNEDIRKMVKEKWLKIGDYCDPDYILFTKGIDIDEKSKTESKKKVQKNLEKKTASISVQTTIKTQNASVQTAEIKDKDANKQLLNAVLEMKNKLNNLCSKKDAELKQLQKKNDDLNEKFFARENKRQEKAGEFQFFKEQYLSLEKKYEQSQKYIEHLHKLLLEQFQQKYQMQKNIYLLFEEKCEYKIQYLVDIQKYLTPSDRPTPEECKQEVAMWQNTLGKINGSKNKFEVYYRSIDDLMVAKKYSTIKINDWPILPSIPNDAQDLIYRNFKVIVQQSKSLYNMTFASNYFPPPPTQASVLSGFGNYQLSCNLANDNGYKEDGRTTGSPMIPQKLNINNSIYKPFNPPFVLKESLQSQPQRKLETPPTSQSSTSHINFMKNKKCETKTSNSTNDLTTSFKSEEDILKFVQAYFKHTSECELSEAICQVQELTGTTVINLSKKFLLDEMRKILKKNSLTRNSWNNIAQTSQWQNDHSYNNCCICMEEFDASNSHSLPCQHEFHKKCITDWLKRQSACPVCRIHCVIDEEFPPLKA